MQAAAAKQSNVAQLRHTHAAIEFLENAITLFKTLDPDVPLNSVLVFLQTCLGYTEDVCFRDLAKQLETSTPTTSRLVAALTEERGGLGLVQTKTNYHDNRRRSLYLTTKGRLVRDQLLEKYQYLFEART
ncbi:hypothetical protein HEQ69_11105 [Haematospirillum jordaniae]|uniref:hypothetical protein n=1 Tax=Haematospirillum jordaniae TaxID=1549855 RepID=UPI00143314E7|nr:hypothetical protein [Haematospirillum jordaniae]NKD46251.1 hypothetical protein [Haematospirillum jordaniae]